MPAITIGPEFFSKALNDYNNWHWALVREFNQNGIDCGSKNIDWSVRESDNKTFVTVANDGEPMTEEILVGKLLSLGSSGKNFSGVGGFGKAKEVLYLAHESYSIRTGGLHVEGSGGNYELTANVINDVMTFIPGTESQIVIDGHHADAIKAQFMEFVFYGQWSGTFTWNGEKHKAEMRKGSSRRDLGFGTVYTNKSAEYTLVVRMNGQPMFTQSCGLNRCVVVELSGTSGDVLTANRDGLTWEHRNNLSTFVTELSVDKRSALRKRQETYRHYDGSRLCHRKVDSKVVSTATLLDIPQTEYEGLEDADEFGESDPGRIQELAKLFVDVDTEPVIDLFGEDEIQERTAEYHEEHASRPGMKAAAYTAPAPVVEVQVAISEEFVIKNETDLVVPTYYRPDEVDFSSYSKKLARIWGRLMLQLHRTFNHEADFAIGFLFSEDHAAQFEDAKFGKVYYLAPAKLVEQTGTYSKSWKKAFLLTERNRVLAIAVHEFAHGLGFDIHDEEYAGKLTDLMGKVMDARKDFNWCWR